MPARRGRVHSRRRQRQFKMARVVMKMAQFEARLAQPSDADDIALAHRDSIRSIGPNFYPPDVVDDWQDGLIGDVYRRAMERGEVVFIATENVDGKVLVLGFATDYRIEGSRHGTSVYVRGIASRRGIGSVLLGLAEAHAIAAGATRIEVEASLAGVEFYSVNGFTEVGRGETNLMSGRPIACVFMRKDVGVGIRN
jgi:putative acetyltransferase